MGEADGYRLEPVRDVRARDERVKQGDLAGAVGDARKTQAALDAIDARAEALRAAIAKARTQAAPTAIGIARVERYVAKLRRDLEATLDERERAEAAHRGQLAAVDAARGRLARARADKELIERHFTRWRDERRKLAERRED